MKKLLPSNSICRVSAIRAVRLLLIAVALGHSATLLAAQTLEGKAIRITDGDSFTLLLGDHAQSEVRLAEVDAPERGQPYSNESRAALRAMIDGKYVRVEVQNIDRYGRVVGRVYVDDLDVSAEMVESGNAWAYRRYLSDRRLLELEQTAQRERRGLWSTTEARATPPWEWRKDTQSMSTDRQSNCAIKGNINRRGERIYHVPGSRYYSQTRINTAAGERWFCSEAEARSAGWRAPR